MSDDHPPAVEIRDPALDGEALARRVQEQALRRECLDPAVLGTGPLLPAEGTPGAAPVGFPGVRESLAELIGRSGLAEPEFRSGARLGAGLIVAIRRAWNWMSTKWYVRPILWQQSDINGRTARLLSDLAHWHELDARRVQELEAQVAALEERLARLEGENRP